MRDFAIGPSAHVSDEELTALTGVRLGDRLLAVDPDAVAARLTTHPWILTARVRRELPSTLSIEVTERRAVATALLGALYLLDDGGPPVQARHVRRGRRAAGHHRRQPRSVRRRADDQRGGVPAGAGLFSTYAEGHPERPKLSEIHVDPRAGFSLVLFEGSGEVRLGRGDFDGKLARLDRIFAALGPRGPGALSVVYLDGPLSDRVALRMTARHTAED